MPGLQRPEELTRLGLELMAIEAGASPGDVPTVGSGGSVTYQPAGGGADFPDSWTISAAGNLTIDNLQQTEALLTLNGASNQTEQVLIVNNGGVEINGNDRNQELLVLTAGAGQASPYIAVRNSNNNEYFLIDPAGGIQLSANPDGGNSSLNLSSTALTFKDENGDILVDIETGYVFLGSIGSGGVTPSGATMIGVNSAPPDGELFNGFAALWFDSTNGAAKLKIKAKQANGTVVSGEVALA